MTSDFCYLPILRIQLWVRRPYYVSLLWESENRWRWFVGFCRSIEKVVTGWVPSASLPFVFCLLLSLPSLPYLPSADWPIGVTTLMCSGVSEVPWGSQLLAGTSFHELKLSFLSAHAFPSISLIKLRVTPVQPVLPPVEGCDKSSGACRVACTLTLNCTASFIRLPW